MEKIDKNFYLGDTVKEFAEIEVNEYFRSKSGFIDTIRHYESGYNKYSIHIDSEEGGIPDIYRTLKTTRLLLVEKRLDIMWEESWYDKSFKLVLEKVDDILIEKMNMI